MFKQRYGIEVAELILKRYCGDWVDFTSNGVLVKKELVESPDTSQVFEWTPACEMDWADAPDPLTHPALPANFSSRELAAFLLDGVGRMVANEYGDFSDGPDADALERLGIRGAKAKQVLEDAYANLRNAMHKVGCPDMALMYQAEAIRHQYQEARSESLEREKVMEPNDAGLPEDEYMKEYRRRLKLAVAPLANLEREMVRVNAIADTSWKRWRHAMVAQLMRPGTEAAECETTPSPHAQTDAAAAVTEPYSPRPLQRQEAQEQAILRLIRNEGHDPLRLPKNEPGKPGIKAIARKALQSDPIFLGATVFEKAWERLRKGEEIADQL